MRTICGALILVALGAISWLWFRPHSRHVIGGFFNDPVAKQVGDDQFRSQFRRSCSLLIEYIGATDEYQRLIVIQGDGECTMIKRIDTDAAIALTTYERERFELSEEASQEIADQIIDLNLLSLPAEYNSKSQDGTYIHLTIKCGDLVKQVNCNNTMPTPVPQFFNLVTNRMSLQSRQSKDVITSEDLRKILSDFGR